MIEEEKSIGEKWVESAERAGQIKSQAGMINLDSVADLVTGAVTQEVALERQRCAACAQYELDAANARAEHSDKPEWYIAYKEGAAVANWIKKAILRGDKEQVYRYEP